MDRVHVVFNVIIQNRTPDWVRARVLAVSMLVFQGAMAAGSAVWGSLATRTDIHVALIWAGVGTMATTVLGLFLKLPDAGVDVTPWVHWRLPTMLSKNSAAVDAGQFLSRLNTMWSLKSGLTWAKLAMWNVLRTKQFKRGTSQNDGGHSQSLTMDDIRH